MERLLTSHKPPMSDAKINQHKESLAAIEDEFRKYGHTFYAYLVGMAVAAISRWDDHGPGRKNR